MKINKRNIYDQFGEAVQAASRICGFSLNYIYAPYDEIVQRLADHAKAPVSHMARYPLVALVTDVPIFRSSPALFGEGTFQVVIATLTLQKYTSEERTRISFEPILWPAYDALMTGIVKCGYFSHISPDYIPHEVVDRYNFGRTRAFVDSGNGADFIDALVISNLKLKIKSLKTCKS